MDLFQNLLNKISAPGGKPTAYTEGWITVPGKGRRWRDTKGNYYMQQPGRAQSFTNRLAGSVAAGWREADKRLGGWLPGGGVASPITRQVSPPQPFPGRSQELYEQTGVRARFVDTDKTPTLGSKTFSLAHGEQGVRAHANVFQNEVGFPGYQGGRSPEERETEMHELGHINPADRSYYTYGGVVGRGLGNLSDRLGNPPLLEIGAGIAKQYLDAPEEDRAERFAARHAGAGGYTPPFIDEKGRSRYGDSLREWGRERVLKGLGPLGTATLAAQGRVQTAINERQADPIRKEIQQLEPKLKQLLEAANSDQVSPELMSLNKRHSELLRQLEKLNIR